MEINGLPLHPLVIHAAVVLGPLAALASLAYAAVPGSRDLLRERLRWPAVALAVAATLSIVAAYLSGRDFLDANPALAREPLVAIHEERAELLLWLAIGYGVVSLAAHALHRRVGAVRVAARGLLAVAAVAVLVQVVRVGDAGARAVWQQF